MSKNNDKYLFGGNTDPKEHIRGLAVIHLLPLPLLFRVLRNF